MGGVVSRAPLGGVGVCAVLYFKMGLCPGRFIWYQAGAARVEHQVARYSKEIAENVGME